MRKILFIQVHGDIQEKVLKKSINEIVKKINNSQSKEHYYVLMASFKDVEKVIKNLKEDSSGKYVCILYGKGDLKRVEKSFDKKDLILAQEINYNNLEILESKIIFHIKNGIKILKRNRRPKENNRKSKEFLCLKI